VAGGGGRRGGRGGDVDGVGFPLDTGAGRGTAAGHDEEGQAAVVGREVVLEAEEQAATAIGVELIILDGQPGDGHGSGKGIEGTGMGADSEPLTLGDEENGDGVLLGEGGEGSKEGAGGLGGGGGRQIIFEGIDEEEAGAGGGGEGVFDLVNG
jgi:hypothetical protein